MSIQAVSTVLESDIPDPHEKLILVVLANYTNHRTGRCYPSVETISRESSCSRRTVQRKLAALEERGWLRRDVGAGRGNSNHYYLDLAALPAHNEDERDEPETPKNSVTETPFTPLQGDIKGDSLTPFSEKASATTEKGVTQTIKGVTDDIKGVTSDAQTYRTVKNRNEPREPRAREREAWPPDRSSQTRISHDDISRSPPLALYREHFPDSHVNAYQQELMYRHVDDLDAWRETLEFWRGNDYRSRNVARILEHYRERLLDRQAEQPRDPAAAYERDRALIAAALGIRPGGVAGAGDGR